MTAPAALLHELLADAAPAEGAVEIAAAVAGHQAHRRGGFGRCVAELVVPDERLGELARRHTGSEPLRVCALNTSGAGGLVALAGRALSGVEVVAVRSALRDLDDLSNNAARIVSAAHALDDSVVVYVEIPHAPGWSRALEVVEAAGLHGAVRADRGIDPQLLEQLSGLIEADLPFSVIGLRSGLSELLVAVAALVDGASVSQVLQLTGSGTSVSARGWDDTQAARVRRRLRRVETPVLAEIVHELVAAGLLGEG